MTEVLETSQISTREIYYPSSSDNEEIIHPEQREDDMGETSIHAKLISSFLQMLLYFFHGCEDVFLSTNLNLYYEKGSPNKWYAPDILIAFGVPNHERTSYQIWKETVFPQVIFEVVSDKTWDNDIGKKYKDYEQFGVEEYYILDPEFDFLPAPMLAFHRQDERLLTALIADDRIFSPRLGLEIVRTENTFRLFNPNTNKFLLTLEEAEVEKQKAEVEKQKFESRAIRAESELERLKAEIEKLKSENKI